MLQIGRPAGFRSVRNGAWVCAAALILIILGRPEPVAAQMINPFTGQIGAMGVMGRMGPQSFAPYGSQSGAMAHILQSGNGLMMSSQSSLPNLMNGLSRIFGMEARARRFPVAQDNTGMAEGLMGEVPNAAESVEIKGPEGDVGEGILELIVGACAGGAFIGAFAAATAAPAAGAVVVAAPLAATSFATAMGVGCGLGIATAAVSVGTVLGYRGVMLATNSGGGDTTP